MHIINFLSEHKSVFVYIVPFISLFLIFSAIRVALDNPKGRFNKKHLYIISLVIALCGGLFLHRQWAGWAAIGAMGMYFFAYLVTTPQKPTWADKLRQQSAKALGSAAVCSAALGIVSGYGLSLSMGPSMWPAAPKSATISFLNARAYARTAPAYGDDIEFETSGKKGWDVGRFRKRIWALPGDTIEVAGNQIRVNGKTIADCASEKEMIAQDLGRVWWCHAQFPQGKKLSFVWGEINPIMFGDQKIKLGPQEIFVIGDNTIESGDSREYGPIDVSWVQGKFADRSPTKEKWRAW